MPAQFCGLAVGDLRSTCLAEICRRVKLRVVTYVTHHPGNLQRDRAAGAGRITGVAIASRGSDDLANNIAGAKVFARRTLRENQRLRVGEHTGRIALDQRQLDDAEEIRIHRADAFQELPVAGHQGDVVDVEPGHRGHLRNVGAHFGRHQERNRRGGKRIARGQDERHLDAIKIQRVRNPAVVRQLIADEQDHEDDAGQPHPKPGNIDKAVELVPDQVAQRGHEIVLEQASLLFGAQSVDGIGAGDAQGMDEDGGPGDRQGDCASAHKVKRA